MAGRRITIPNTRAALLALGLLTAPFTPFPAHSQVPTQYTVSNDATGSYVARTGTTFAATAADKAQAAPLHFQAFDLGKYLLFATRTDFLGGPMGAPDPRRILKRQARNGSPS